MKRENLVQLLGVAVTLGTILVTIFGLIFVFTH